MLKENIFHFNNSLSSFLEFVLAFFVFVLLFRLFQRYILQKFKKIAKKTKTDIDDVFLKIIESIKPPFYLFLSFYLAFQFLDSGVFLEKIVNTILIIWITIQIIFAIQILIDYIIKKFFLKEKNETSKTSINLIGKIFKGILWAIGLLLILSNLGIDITSLIAGLGIGGIAVALALQNVLGDLFSSFALHFDKPFEVGDYIVIGPHSGIVQKIGIKTTRIMALQGEEIVISNQELTSTRIQNFKKMEERRICFSFGVVYEISSEKLKQIPEIIEKIIQNNKLIRFDRAHFVKFDDSALLFDVVYYISSSEYTVYRQIHQEILFKIKEEFEKKEIVMAYPTQTLYVQDNSKS